ncbi:nuclear transport factor 2 family protein [Flagellimonas allohymeniacidonis]|uniref:Nuclear transport factor 2 family protein n=1 Tax=Flagellimonas allohymeniacidonis TaxID=2517819 RepID=A0A4Q8QIA4_9FLAO|nr:nuclear transport factor 2 family protein [Allomuricauda hymeniacidonis]TAI49577.1 nuclear transport factor 2 family protein [Allomuricauda hymeniacidonis]
MTKQKNDRKLLVLFAFFLSSGVLAQTVNHFPAEGAKQQIQMKIDHLLDNLKEGNVAVLESYHYNGEESSYFTKRGLLDYDGIVALESGFFSSLRNFDSQVHNLRVDLVGSGKDVAICTFIYSYSGIFRDTPIAREGLKVSAIFIKTGDEWQVVHKNVSE